MEIALVRWKFSKKSTIGSLYIDGKWECYAIEDADRGLTQQMTLEEIQKAKQYGTTCIPYGAYKVILAMSPRLTAKNNGKIVITPRLQDVPGFDGILIHSANFASQLLGCIAPGLSYQDDVVWNSKPAFNELFPILKAASDAKEEIIINITRSNTEPQRSHAL